MGIQVLLRRSEPTVLETYTLTTTSIGIECIDARWSALIIESCIIRAAFLCRYGSEDPRNHIYIYIHICIYIYIRTPIHLSIYLPT